MTDLADRFTEIYGDRPEGVWAAPGRVNLMGEHTDYNDGFVLPFALADRTFAAVRRRDDAMLALRSVQRDEQVLMAIGDITPGAPEGWAGYAAGVVWAMREAGHDVPGLSVLLDGQVPVGSGLSSSAALECATAIAIRDVCLPGVSDVDLVILAQRAENDFVGAPTGIMDQFASMVCRAGQVLFLDVRTRDIEQVPFDPTVHDAALLVIDTQVHHSHADGAYGDRRRDCEVAARELGVTALRDISLDQLDTVLPSVGTEVRRRRVRHIVTENSRVLATVEALHGDDFAEVGRLMTESHRSLSQDYEVSCAELDLAVDAALSAGAIGARMTGGGFGGCAIALVPADRVDAATEAIGAAFGDKDLTAPRIWSARPSEGATRIE